MGKIAVYIIFQRIHTLDTSLELLRSNCFTSALPESSLSPDFVERHFDLVDKEILPDTDFERASWWTLDFIFSMW